MKDFGFSKDASINFCAILSFVRHSWNGGVTGLWQLTPTLSTSVSSTTPGHEATAVVEEMLQLKRGRLESCVFVRWIEVSHTVRRRGGVPVLCRPFWAKVLQLSSRGATSQWRRYNVLEHVYVGHFEVTAQDCFDGLANHLTLNHSYLLPTVLCFLSQEHLVASFSPTLRIWMQWSICGYHLWASIERCVRTRNQLTQLSSF